MQNMKPLTPKILEEPFLPVRVWAAGISSCVSAEPQFSAVSPAYHHNYRAATLLWTSHPPPSALSVPCYNLPCLFSTPYRGEESLSTLSFATPLSCLSKVPLRKPEFKLRGISSIFYPLMETCQSDSPTCFS